MDEGLTAGADWVLILPVVLPLLGAALLVMLRSGRDLHLGFAAVIVAAVAFCDAELLRRTLADGPVAMTLGRWMPPFGISFAADVMGALFATVAAGVTLVVLIYAQGFRREPDGRDGFYPLVLLLLAGASGSFLTGDLFNLYVWFEVMLISSFGLLVIGGRPLQLDAALKYGFLNFLATTFFLLGLGLLYGLLGTLNMADILRAAPEANRAAMAAVAAVLLLAFGIKAAAFPVNSWLPASYHAPPAAISALMAGLLTKVAVYALLRTLGMLLPESRDLLDGVIVAVVIATLVIAPLGAIAETNLRRALGFIVIGGIGAALAGLALPSEDGFSGSVVYVVHAMLTMTALYLVAGLIEQATGETDTRRMGGLYAGAPVLAAAFVVLMLAVSGVPPFLGFWPKLLLLQAGLAPATPDLASLAVAVALLLNALLTLIAATRLWSHVFWRQGPEGSDSEDAVVTLRPLDRRQRWFGLGAAAVLTAVVAAVGLWPEPLLMAGKAAAIDLVDPAEYTRAVGLEPLP